MKRWLAVVALLGSLAPGLATAQAWPNKQIRMVVPYGAGSSSDVVARIVSENLTQGLGQIVLVENRPGAGQNIGTQAIVTAPPDGYNLLIASEIIVVEHLLDKTTPFNAYTDLAPVARITGTGTLLVVPGNFPANTLQEYIAVVKANPGKYNYATTNNFELPEMVYFRDKLGLKMVLVPYKTGINSNQAVATGEAHTFAAAPNDTLTFSQGGRQKVLAYTGSTPHFLFPKVPTVASLKVGLDDFEAAFAFGLFYPAKTSQDIINKLHNVAVEFTRNPQAVKRFLDIGYEPYSPSIAEYKASLANKVKGIQDMQAKGLKLR